MAVSIEGVSKMTANSEEIERELRAFWAEHGIGGMIKYAADLIASLRGEIKTLKESLKAAQEFAKADWEQHHER